MSENSMGLAGSWVKGAKQERNDAQHREYPPLDATFSVSTLRHEVQKRSECGTFALLPFGENGVWGNATTHANLKSLPKCALCSLLRVFSYNPTWSENNL